MTRGRLPCFAKHLFMAARKDAAKLIEFYVPVHIIIRQNYYLSFADEGFPQKPPRPTPRRWTKGVTNKKLNHDTAIF